MSFRDDDSDEEVDDQDQEDDYEHGEFELQLTRLICTETEMLRLNPNGTRVLVLDLTSIKALHAETRFAVGGPALVLVGLGLVAIAWFFVPNVFFACVMYLAAAALATLGAFGFFVTYVVLETNDGPLAIYCSDERDEADCFVVSVRRHLALRNEK